MQTRRLGNSNLEVSAIGFGCMGISFGYGQPAGRCRGHCHHPRGLRARRHVLRHGRSLRTVHERRAGRRGAWSNARPGRDRHQVRLQVRQRQAGWAGQPAGAHSRGGGGVAEEAQDRSDRPPLPAPRRPRRANRRRRRCGQGLDWRRQGRALRAVRSGAADHPSRARRRACHRPSERVLAVVARAGKGNAAAARGAGHRLRPVQPARQGLPHGADRRQDDVRAHRFQERRCPASPRRIARRISPSSSG